MKTAKKGQKQITANTLKKMLKDIKEVYGVLGLFEQDSDEFIKEMKQKYLKKLDIQVDYINLQIEKRKEAKINKEFDLADNIRNDLESKGIILKDTVDGTLWDLKDLY